jgi:hypothetical protein
MDFICDLDGTLFNVEHRRHFIATKPKNWPAFMAGIKNDTPNSAVLEIVWALRFSQSDQSNRVIFCSGREEKHREVSIKKLWECCIESDFDLYMRANGDYRADDLVKLDLLEQMRKDGYDPKAAIDDRKRVCDAWIKAGLFVFDVGQGKGDF